MFIVRDDDRSFTLSRAFLAIKRVFVCKICIFYDSISALLYRHAMGVFLFGTFRKVTCQPAATGCWDECFCTVNSLAALTQHNKTDSVHVRNTFHYLTPNHRSVGWAETRSALVSKLPKAICTERLGEMMLPIMAKSYSLQAVKRMTVFERPIKSLPCSRKHFFVISTGLETKWHSLLYASKVFQDERNGRSICTFNWRLGIVLRGRESC